MSLPLQCKNEEKKWKVEKKNENMKHWRNREIEINGWINECVNELEINYNFKAKRKWTNEQNIMNECAWMR